MGYRMNLSKSRYCRGLQCPKMLWLEKYRPEETANTANEAVLTGGTKVGELAQSYFGACQVVPYDENKTVMCDATRALMAAGAENICEASFAVDGLYCAVDILCRNGAGWDIVEVKSSTYVSPIYVEDLAFQYYVLTRCGVQVKSASILCIDKDYVLRGALDIHGLFRREDHTETCRSRLDRVAENIEIIRSFVDTDTEPVRDIGCHCCEPYECAFRGYCGKHLPSPSVFDIAGMGTEKKYELYHKGILSFEDILREKPKLTRKQLQQVEMEMLGSSPACDSAAIGRFLKGLRYPVYHLDFETFMQAVPEYQGCSPYCQIPFQYSLHIEEADGTLTHREFLAEAGADPRRQLAEQLCRDIPADACCLAYNMSFEKKQLAKLAEEFPDLSGHLLAIAGNMQDLMAPFQSRQYYDRAMEGSYSIKKVLPALFPEDPSLNYQNLEGVHRGDEASAAYAALAEKTPEEAALIRSQLLTYCGLDTYAMVRVLGKLRTLTGES